jgi:hypothetical protein
MMKTKRVLLISLALFMPFMLSAQQEKAEKIIDELINAYKKQHAGVRDMKTVQNDAVIYEKWVENNGETMYKWRKEEQVNGQTLVSLFDGETYYTTNPRTGVVEEKDDSNINPMDFYEYLKTIGYSYAGKADVDGKSCHVIKAEDVPVDKLAQMTAPESSEKQSQQQSGEQEILMDMQIFVDDSKWVVPKIVTEFDGSEMGDDMSEMVSKVRSEVRNMDFRKVEGMLIAHKIITTTQMKMTPKGKQQSAQMKEAMQSMKEEMADMPPEQKAMMESRMKAQMGKGMQMMTGEKMETIKKIESVEVNTGLSDKLFDPEKL